MRAELILLGKRVSMARQARRRALVVAIYAVLAALAVLGWRLDGWRSISTWLIWAALGACWLFLGGHYSRGLVKQFNGKGPRNADAMPSDLQLLFGLYRLPANEQEYRNDEKELRDRDRSHYYAYQGIGWALAALWILAILLIHKPHLLARFSLAVDQLLYGIFGIFFVLYATLPQSILLWTEPDMEEGQ
jgi:hypothetical protein